MREASVGLQRFLDVRRDLKLYVEITLFGKLINIGKVHPSLYWKKLAVDRSLSNTILAVI